MQRNKSFHNKSVQDTGINPNPNTAPMGAHVADAFILRLPWGVLEAGRS